MTALPDTMTPENWLRQLFSSKAARDGGVVRRQKRDIERIVGLDAFHQELRRRGYRAAINDAQVVIFCNTAPIRIIE